jgi:hypothetical protein
MAAPQHMVMGIANAMTVAMAAIAFTRIQEDASAANTGAIRGHVAPFGHSGGEECWEGLAVHERERWKTARVEVGYIRC